MSFPPDAGEPFSAPTPAVTSPSSGYASAFGSADPTPTHKSKSTMDFDDDPFKNANHRYGDPFEISGGDPFQDKDDPFTSSVSAAFGPTSIATVREEDPFTSSATSIASSGDPFSLTLKNSLKAPASSSPSKDPFGLSAEDPFSSAFGGSRIKSGNTTISKSVSSVDPFGNSFVDPFGSKTSKDDWFAQAPPATSPKVDGVAKKFPKSSSKSLATSWSSGPDPFGGGSIGKSSVTKVSNADPFTNVVLPQHKNKPLNKAGQHLTDFLTGSPLRGGEPSSAVKEKKKKWGPKLPSLKSDKSGKSGSGKMSSSQEASKSIPNIDEVHLKMASEASRRAEEDRRRRLQLQEEQDLAYAIALSKAEAASLKTSTTN